MTPLVMGQCRTGYETDRFSPSNISPFSRSLVYMTMDILRMCLPTFFQEGMTLPERCRNRVLFFAPN
jgi:hypothetical protein